VLPELLVPEELVAVLVDVSVEVIVDRSVEVVPDEVSVPVEVEEPVDVADPVTTPVAVPVAPEMPKLGEKLMLLALLSSMISIEYK